MYYIQSILSASKGVIKHEQNGGMNVVTINRMRRVKVVYAVERVNEYCQHDTMI